MNKIFWGLHCSMGLYGATRGFRSVPKYNKDKPVLFTDKIVSSIICGYMYTMPLLNLMYVKSLVDRIEIHIKKLDKETYKSCYTETTGICDSTL